MDELKITLKEQTYTVVDYWWEDDDFIFVSDKDEQIRCKNAYPVSIKFGDLEYSSNELCTIQNNKLWGTMNECK